MLTGGRPISDWCYKYYSVLYTFIWSILGFPNFESNINGKSNIHQDHMTNQWTVTARTIYNFFIGNVAASWFLTQGEIEPSRIFFLNAEFK